MADIAISVAAKVAEYFVTPVLRSATRHARFLFCAGKIKRNLESVKAELISKQESVKKQKHEALNRTEIIDEAVEKWLNEVTSVIEEVGKPEQEMKEGSSCCWGWCSTLKGYHLCKEFAKITETMKSQNQKGEFNPFSHPAPIPDIEFFSSGNFIFFESTTLAFEQLLTALEDDSVYMIGLLGMGGCGKTTLAKEVSKKAKELKLYHHVVFTTISQIVNVKKIQGDIADFLNFKLKSENENGRARELSLRLQSGEQILIILDDVWSKLNLEDIGIPFHNNHKGCKVLLTTRRKQTCFSMDCERVISLTELSDKDAWTLFQKHTHVVDESSLNVAREVVGECKGLPIAIVAVARASKGRSSDWWYVALNKLRTSKPIDVEENEKDAYSCLELSYKYLPNDEARLLLKICCMFPEDYKIPLEQLFRYGIGLGMCEGVDSFDLARSIVNIVIEVLIDSSLLLPCQNENNGVKKYFNIHDVVRDVILWIASKEDSTIMVDSERSFSTIAENGSLKDCYAVSLWYKEIDEFPQHLDAPKLQFLLLNLQHDLDFSHASFERMKELKLMSLLNNHRFLAWDHVILSLPLSTQWKWFNNLHTLRLVKQKIGDISFVESLRRLKILDLAGSVFKKLPNGIAYMNSELKLMDLSYCKIEEEEDCSEVIGRCSQLQELYMPPEIALPYECFMCDTFPKLQRYRLNIYNHNCKNWNQFQFDWSREFRVVSIGNMNISNLCPTVGDLLKRASAVRVDGLVGGCESMIPDLVQAFGRTNELTMLYLCSCSDIECVIDKTTFDNADSFRVDAKFSSLGCAFEKLKYLSIEDCPNLTSLFPSSAAQSLLQLEGLRIYDCRELKHIIIKEENGIDADEMEIFPNLKRINISGRIDLEYIFPISVARTLSSLEYIWIRTCGQLKHIIKNEGESDATMYIIRTNEERPSRPCFPKLRELTVLDCNELKCLFSISMVAQLPQLEELFIESTEGLEEIMTENEESHNQFSSQPCFPKLRGLTVMRCNKLKSLFSLFIAAQLSQLERLRITDAAQLEQAFGYKNNNVSCNTDKIMLPNLSQLTLEMMPNFVDICSHLKVHAVKLRMMHVMQCPKFDSVHEWITQAQVINYRQVCNEISYVDDSSFEEEQEKIITPNLESLFLKDLPDLMFIWKGATLINFQNLVELCVVACGKLKFIFPACAVRSLPTLKSLRIRNCEELEQIFGYGIEKHDYDGKVIELGLQELIDLELFRLPRFTSFGGDLQFQLKFQALEYCKVRYCPNLSSTTLATLENILPSHNSGNESDDESEDALVMKVMMDLKMPALTRIWNEQVRRKP